MARKRKKSKRKAAKRKKSRGLCSVILMRVGRSKRKQRRRICRYKNGKIKSNTKA